MENISAGEKQACNISILLNLRKDPIIHNSKLNVIGDTLFPKTSLVSAPETPLDTQTLNAK